MGRYFIASVILLWSDSLLRIKLSKLKSVLKRCLKGFWEIYMIITWYNLVLQLLLLLLLITCRVICNDKGKVILTLNLGLPYHFFTILSRLFSTITTFA